MLMLGSVSRHTYLFVDEATRSRGVRAERALRAACAHFPAGGGGAMSSAASAYGSKRVDLQAAKCVRPFNGIYFN
jgi:hypothetical protein